MGITTKTISQDNRSPCRDSIAGPPEYEVLIPRRRRSMSPHVNIKNHIINALKQVTTTLISIPFHIWPYEHGLCNLYRVSVLHANVLLPKEPCAVIPLVTSHHGCHMNNWKWFPYVPNCSNKHCLCIPHILPFYHNGLVFKIHGNLDEKPFLLATQTMCTFYFQNYGNRLRWHVTTAFSEFSCYLLLMFLLLLLMCNVHCIYLSLFPCHRPIAYVNILIKEVNWIVNSPSTRCINAANDVLDLLIFLPKTSLLKIHSRDTRKFLNLLYVFTIILFSFFLCIYLPLFACHRIYAVNKHSDKGNEI